MTTHPPSAARPFPMRHQQTHGRRRALPWLLAVLALGLLAATALSFAGHRSRSEALRQRVLPHLRTEAATRALDRLAREPDAARAKAEAARILVGEALLPPQVTASPSLAQRVAALEEARGLAEEALVRRPGSARAATALGAALYLSRSLSRDDRLFTEAPAWEAPLWRARELAPGDEEAGRVLALAYLEVWPALPEWKQEEARELVRRGLADPQTYPLLLGPWMGVAPSLAEALAQMPEDQPRVWSTLAQLVESQGAWEAYGQLEEPWWEASQRKARAALEEAATRRAHGEDYGAAVLLLEAVGELPLDARAFPLLREILELMPGAGEVGGGAVEAGRTLAPWRELSLDLCLIGACPLSAEHLAHLYRLARPSDPARAATAALAAGSFSTAISFERQATVPLGEPWAPYLIGKAYYLADRGQYPAAAEALSLARPPWRDHPATWRARLTVAEAAGDEDGAARAREALEGATRESWPEEPPWRQDGRRFQLLWPTPSATQGSEICVASKVARTGPGLPAAELLWDSERLGVAVPDASGDLCLPLRTGADLHLLELRVLGIGGITPQGVRLRPPA